MRYLLILYLISIPLLAAAQGKQYYVSSTGNNTNSGTSVNSSWQTLTYALGSTSPVTAGDTVFISAGLYNENVVVAKSGTAGSPIVIQGYKLTPRDNPPLLVNKTDPYSSFLTTDMPTFDGGNRSSGIAISCYDKKYLVFKNFQIRNYAYGFIAGGAGQDAGNITLDNINVSSIGNTASSYSGIGIIFGSMGTKFSNNNVLANCLVTNSAAEGIGINGNYNELTNCKVYCNENTNNAATDYYIIITGSNNTLSKCHVERAPGLTHLGHGIGAKTNAEQVIDRNESFPSISSEYNKFMNCTARNMGESFYVRHRTARFNQFIHCQAYGTHTGTTNSPGGEGNGIIIRDGASNNIFDGIVADYCNAGIVFNDTVEDGDTGTNPTGHPGNNNSIINSLFLNCYIGVSFNEYSIPSDAGDNTIANCTFYKTRYIHYAARSCKKIKYINNIYVGCLPSKPGGNFKSGTFSDDIIPNGTDTYFKNCIFYNIQGGISADFVSASLNNNAADPLFTNADGGDFHLKAASPCINKGLTLSIVPNDFDNTLRPQESEYDIGAFEYSSSPPVSLPANAGPISGPKQACQDQNNITLTVSPIARATSYIWTLPPGITGTSTSNSITISIGKSAASGIIAVKGRNTSGDGSPSFIDIVINAKPPQPTIIAEGANLQSSVAIGNQWYNTNGPISGATRQNYVATESSDYYVIVTIATCSSDPSNSIKVVITNVEDSMQKNEIHAVPNPFNSQLLIQSNINTGKLTFELVNSIGIIVSKGETSPGSTIATELLPQGVYYLRLNTAQNMITTKLLKE